MDCGTGYSYGDGYGDGYGNGSGYGGGYGCGAGGDDGSGGAKSRRYGIETDTRPSSDKGDRIMLNFERRRNE